MDEKLAELAQELGFELKEVCEKYHKKCEEKFFGDIMIQALAWQFMGFRGFEAESLQRAEEYINEWIELEREQARLEEEELRKQDYNERRAALKVF